MKSRVLSLFVLCIIAFMFAACGDDPFAKEPSRPALALLSLTIQPIEMQNDVPVDKPGVEPLVADFYKYNSKTETNELIQPVIEEDWDDIFYNLTEADSREVWFLLDEHVQTARVIATATTGSRIQWGIGNSGQRPSRFTSPGEPLTFGDNDFIYIMVSTRDEQFRSYYRFHARLASPVTLLSNLVINENRKGTYPDWIQPADSWDKTETDEEGNEKYEGSISITLAEGTNGCTVAPTKFDANSSLMYAVAKDGIAPSFGSGDHLSFADQDLLYVKVVAQNTVDESFYRFRVNVGRITTIAKLKFDTFEVGRLGVPLDDWGGVVSGLFATADQPGVGFSIDIELDDHDGNFEFGKIDSKTEPLVNVQFDNPNKIWFDNKHELAIKVTSATMQTGVPVVTMYYKIQVDLLAALIKKQPKSAVYYIDSSTLPTPYYGPIASDSRSYIDVADQYNFPVTPAVVPLSVELDRAGTFTYQWYTANSWYGGYGFDEIGKIVGEDGCHVGVAPWSKYHPSTERGGFDEKNNVSLHNGGNQFYRLPISNEDATMIPASEGGTSATYAPPVDLSRRPFLAGYSNQSQYYWVVITDDNGYEVTSERCVVITEWNEVWDLGRPTGNKVNKKHYIVNLNDIVPAGQEGIHLPPMNTNPFTFKREKYDIPITFPADFDIMDYSVCTAQAKFFFKDGTPWIQNWTQGDIYFNENSVQMVGFYNLTNNNATLGLAGDSKDPQGADLLVTPDTVVIAPAGEKPVDEKPPFEADGVTPININDAQGWFCAFIELVELRFEGPARPR